MLRGLEWYKFGALGVTSPVALNVISDWPGVTACQNVLVRTKAWARDVERQEITQFYTLFFFPFHWNSPLWYFEYVAKLYEVLEHVFKLGDLTLDMSIFLLHDRQEGDIEVICDCFISCNLFNCNVVSKVLFQRRNRRIALTWTEVSFFFFPPVIFDSPPDMQLHIIPLSLTYFVIFLRISSTYTVLYRNFFSPTDFFFSFKCS